MVLAALLILTDHTIEVNLRTIHLRVLALEYGQMVKNIRDGGIEIRSMDMGSVLT